jgi:hypothetical protein
MPAEKMQFPSNLQASIEAGVLTPHQAWRLEWERVLFPTREWPKDLKPLVQRVNLFLDQDLPMQ